MKGLLVISALLLCLIGSVARADYVYDATSTTQWQFIDTHTIILVKSARPYALVKMPFCFIYSSSRLQVLTDDLGPYQGKILVDDEVCEPQEVVRLT
jgi:hypothetical protein